MEINIEVGGNGLFCASKQWIEWCKENTKVSLPLSGFKLLSASAIHRTNIGLAESIAVADPGAIDSTTYLTVYNELYNKDPSSDKACYWFGIFMQK